MACLCSFQLHSLVHASPFTQITAGGEEKKKKKRPKSAGEGAAGASAGAAKGTKKMKKDFEKESEEDRFNRLSRNLQILLEDQDLNVPKICSTLVRKGDGQPEAATGAPNEDLTRT